MQLFIPIIISLIISPYKPILVNTKNQKQFINNNNKWSEYYEVFLEMLNVVLKSVEDISLPR